MGKINRLLGSMATSPILWSVAATFLLYVPLRAEAGSRPLLARLFLHHNMSQVLTALFLMGAATLFLRLLGVASQRRLLALPLLDAIPPGGQPLADCEGLLNRLDEQPPALQDTYLIRRLREALEYVFRKNAAETLEEEMRHLAAADRTRLSASYQGLRYLMVAVIAIGTIGAVLGNPDGTIAGDVFALSLLLSTALLFAVHVVAKAEGKLVAAVDLRVAAELVGRFESSYHPANDAQVAILRGIGEQLLRTSEQLVTRQTELWKATFVEAQRQWNDWSAGAAKQVQDSLATALAATMQTHAIAVSSSAEQNATHWQSVQQALLQNAEAVTLQQRELVKQGEMLIQVVAATGQVEKLESELNRNLSTLAGAKNFEQTVLSLGAAIQLLNSKLGAVPTPETPKVELKAKRKAA